MSGERDRERRIYRTVGFWFTVSLAYCTITGTVLHFTMGLFVDAMISKQPNLFGGAFISLVIGLCIPIFVMESSRIFGQMLVDLAVLGITIAVLVMAFSGRPTGISCALLYVPVALPMWILTHPALTDTSPPPDRGDE